MKERISITIDKELLEKVNRLMIKMDRSRSWICSAALKLLLKKEG